MLDLATERIFRLASNKAEPLQFAAGEALCFVFGGKSAILKQCNIVIESFIKVWSLLCDKHQFCLGI